MDKRTNTPNLEGKVVESTTNQQQIILPNDSGIIRINLVDGKGFVRTQKQEGQTIYIDFQSKGYKKLSGHLSSPDSIANIRFSQIFMPDGTMDGPFGRDVEYQLPQNGHYRLSIHESLMAGDPWSGVMNIEIQLTK